MVLDQTLDPPERNLALDEALLIEAESEAEITEAHPRLRFWELSTYAVVLGASSRLEQEVKFEACLRDRIPIIRRSSGGGVVVIGPGALNVSIVLDRKFDPALAQVDTAQVFVLQRIAESISSSEVDVRVQGSGDLTLDGRKVAGSAQRRLKRCVLVHATILFSGFDVGVIPRYLGSPLREPDYRQGRPHEEFVSKLPHGREALVERIRIAWGAQGPLRNDSFSIQRVDELTNEKFGRGEWTRRLL